MVANAATGSSSSILRNKLGDAPKTVARSRSMGASASHQNNSQKTAANKENEHETAAGEQLPAGPASMALKDKTDGLTLNDSRNNSITVAAAARDIACQRSAASKNDAKLSRALENANLQTSDIFAPRQTVKETNPVAKALAATTATSLATLQVDDMGLYKPRSNIAPSANKFDFCAPVLRSKENGQTAQSASNASMA